MANNYGDSNKITEKYRNALLEATRLQEELKRECEHNPKSATKGHIISIMDANIPRREKEKLSQTTVFCTGCKAYFEGSSYTREELDAALYLAYSVMQQIKANTSMTEKDRETMLEAYAAYDIFEKLFVYYADMVDKMSKGGQRPNRTKNTKGHVGLDANMIRGRSYN